MLETTPATVARAGNLGALEEPVPDLDFDWRPTPLGKVFESKREYRWPIVAGAALVGFALLFVARFVIFLPADKAEARLAEYATAVDDFSAAIEAMEAAETLTDPAAAGQFLEAAGELLVIARPGPPGSLPFMPAGPVADVRSARHRLLILADAADSIAARLARAARYREASGDILEIPLLPSSAPPELIDPAARALATMHSQSTAAAGRLDDSDEYFAYRQSVELALSTVPGLIDRYLLALRREEEATAVALIAELDTTRADTLAEAEAVLGQVETDAAALILELKHGIAEVRILLGDTG